ncbi:MerR family transcriptional regulator [bacterium AH-315-J21]|nr:MerR family transcriptional regulator [bacterium AH-315-J21]
MRKAIAKRIRLIKNCRLYSTKELAEELGVHTRTIHSWQRQGLSAIDPNAKPFIFRGISAKSFLKNKRLQRKQKLQDGEFYCVSCRRPVKSRSSEISAIFLRNRTSLHIRGRCENCDTLLNRFINSCAYEASAFNQLFTDADNTLYDNQRSIVKTDISKEFKNE